MPNPQRAHASGSPSTPPGPSLAERARTLLEINGHSTLATLSQKHPGYPFASVAPYAADERGRPYLLISAMAMHTRNLSANPRCTLLAAESVASEAALGACRPDHALRIGSGRATPT